MVRASSLRAFAPDDKAPREAGRRVRGARVAEGSTPPGAPLTPPLSPEGEREAPCPAPGHRSRPVAPGGSSVPTTW